MAVAEGFEPSRAFALHAFEVCRSQFSASRLLPVKRHKASRRRALNCPEPERMRLARIVHR